jgi:hypothetical protein
MHFPLYLDSIKRSIDRTVVLFRQSLALDSIRRTVTIERIRGSGVRVFGWPEGTSPAIVSGIDRKAMFHEHEGVADNYVWGETDVGKDWGRCLSFVPVSGIDLYSGAGWFDSQILFRS